MWRLTIPIRLPKCLKYPTMRNHAVSRPISKWSGVNFTDKQKADYVAGKAVKLENVTDKQGFHATMYIKF